MPVSELNTSYRADATVLSRVSYVYFLHFPLRHTQYYHGLTGKVNAILLNPETVLRDGNLKITSLQI